MSKSPKAVIAVLCLASAACATPGGGRAGFRMLDKDQHVAAATALDGTATGVCFSDIAYTHALISGARPGPTGMPETCAKLLLNLQQPSLGTPEAQRNSLAEALITVSNERCRTYVEFLQMYHGNVNNVFGIGSQIAALIGALTTNGTASAFSGISGTIQGAGNTLNKSHFQDKALELIAAAFYQRRARELTALRTNLGKSAAAYPVGRAVADTINYHGACSISAGFQELASAITRPATESQPPK